MSNDEINIDEIVEKIVVDIQNLKDNQETSIFTLAGRNFETTLMWSIYELVVRKLEDVGLYLYHRSSNRVQYVGLPFNIPFKKGYIQNIVISTQKDNATKNKGEILEEISTVRINGNESMIKSSISFCRKKRYYDKANFEYSIQLIFKRRDLIKINKLVNEIKNKYKPCHIEDLSDKNFQFTNLNINGIDYAISPDDKILLKLKKVIKCDFINKSLYKAYKKSLRK